MKNGNPGFEAAKEVCAFLFEHDACGLEGVVANPLHLQKDIVIRIIFKKVAILVSPHIADSGKAFNGYHIIRGDVYDIGSVNGKEKVVAV